jgi:hypothetical protein
MPCHAILATSCDFVRHFDLFAPRKNTETTLEVTTFVRGWRCLLLASRKDFNEKLSAAVQ